MAEEQDPTNPRTFIVRQPIFNDREEVERYQLLFRGESGGASDDLEHDCASAKDIASGSLLLDLKALSCGKQSVVAVSEEAVVNSYVDLLPNDTTTLELAEVDKAGPELVEAYSGLRDKGFKLALPHFRYREELASLVRAVSAIKVDFSQTSRDERRAMVERSAEWDVKLIATSIDTRELLEEARALGYEYFKGNFISDAVVVSTKELPANTAQLLQVLNKIYEPELDFDGLEEAIKMDVALCHKLLRYINSARFSFRVPIESIRRALVAMGETEIRKWASMIILTQVGEEQPAELISQSVVRAKFCESLGKRFENEGRASELFLAGLFSNLDVLLGQPREQALEHLALSDDVKDALLGQGGELSELYDLSLSYGQGRWRDVQQSAAGSEAESEVSSLYVEAVEWGDDTLRTVKGSG